MKKTFVHTGCANQVTGTGRTSVDIDVNANLELVDKFCYTSAHGSGRRYYILLLKFLSFFSFFILSPPDLRDGSTDREPF